MNVRSYTKRLIGLLLCLAMVIGLVPMSVFAVDTTEYLFFATDRHGDTDIIGKLLTQMESVVGDGNVEYVNLGGDMVDGTSSYKSSTVLGEVTGVASNLNNTSVDIVYAYSHDVNCDDDAGILNKTSGLLYEGDNYYVYGVIQSDLESGNGESSAAAFVAWANGADIDTSKAIILMSHKPIHANRGDNGGAGYWHNALNKVATGSESGGEIIRNIVFLHGHNHTVDTTEYYYAPGSKMSIESYVKPTSTASTSSLALSEKLSVVYDDEASTYASANGTSATIYYTYATAGYLTESRGNGQAMLIGVNSTTITLDKYTSSGYTTLGTVTRVVTEEEEPTVKTLSVTGLVAYRLGAAFVEPTVKAVYSDGSEVTLKKGTEEGQYSVSGTYDMNTAGKYTLHYTCTIDGVPAAADFTFEVIDPTATVTYADNLITIQASAYDLTAIEATNVYGEITAVDMDTLYTDYVAYDISLTGHTAGNSIFYSWLLLDDMDSSNLVVYHIADDGTVTSIPYEIVTDEQGNQYIEFTTTYTGIIAYGSAAVPEGYELSKIDVTYSGATKYLVGEKLDLVNIKVIATYTNADGATFTREIYLVDNYVVFDGYTAGGYDMTKSGKQTVVITYGECTDSFDITVYEKTFPDANTGVSATVTVPGVTGIIVSDKSDDETVKNAVSVFFNSYHAFDISLTGHNQGETVTVTLPLPEGVNAAKVKVYYLNSNNLLEPINDFTVNEDNTVTFTTDHFSTYVAGEEAGLGYQYVEVEGTEDKVTSTKTETTIYQRVDAPVAGGQYLIVSGSYGLNGGTTGYSVNTSPDISNYYTAWDTTTNTGTALTSGNYLTTSNAFLWTAGTGWTFTNGSSQLGLTYEEAGNCPGSTDTYELSFDGSNSSWSYSGNQLTNTAYTSYGLTLSGSTWSVNTSPSTVYFYEPITVYTVTTSTEEGKPAGTWKIEGTNTTVGAVNGATVNLNYNTTFTETESGDISNEAPVASGATVTYEVISGDIGTIADNTFVSNGTAGTAIVRVTYTWTLDGEEVTMYDEFTVTAEKPDYNTHIMDGNTDVTGGEVTVKGVTSSTTKQLSGAVNYTYTIDGTQYTGSLADTAFSVTWSSNNTQIAKVNASTGLVSFTGEEGDVIITANFYTADGTLLGSQIVTLHVTKTNATIPEDGTDDFPEYPDEGAVRFDKTATAYGNFSETGIAQVELSMTGVPFTTGSEIDVVIMLDMTGSMSATAMTAAEESAIAFAKQIVQNEDGTYNNNRICVMAFNSGGNTGGGGSSSSSSTGATYTYWEMGVLTADTWDSFCTAVRGASEDQESGGTPYSYALSACKDVLEAAKTTNLPTGVTSADDYDRQQFCVFVSDGGPTSYTYITNYDAVKAGTATAYTTSSATATGGSNQSDSNFATIAGYTHEYYSTLMKDDGVTMYSVLTGLVAANYPNCTTIMQNIASSADDAYVVENGSDTSAISEAFSNIAKKILEAAKDVKVADKISDNFTMVFDVPNATVGSALEGDNLSQDFYIEIKEYALTPVYDTDGTTVINYVRGDSTSLIKLYMGIDGTTYYAASDASGTKYATPVFDQTAIGTMYYWTTDSTKGDSGISVEDANGNTYYFVASGVSTEDEAYTADTAIWYNMASGAYAFGNLVKTDIKDDATGEVTGTNTTCNDLIIATPYFVYNASTRMLVWTAEKLSSSEYALTYFLYLENSGGYTGAEGETLAGSYKTNDYAHLTYTNFQGTDCEVTFPVPTITWNGAQVSYVFYLVNDQGQPVNRAGRVVPFSEAVYVTDVYTHSIVWNDLEQVGALEAEYLAEDLVPSVYKLFDSTASYNIHVFEDEEGQNLNNHFVINGSESVNTTYVFNTKADTTKYSAPGTYAKTTQYLCKHYIDGVTESTDSYGNPVYTGSYTGTDAYTDASGNKVYGKDNIGGYVIVYKSGASTVHSTFDFANTTVAFAVTWLPQLVEDTVIVDFGLDVVVDVTKNDAMAAGVVGITGSAPSVTINSGTYDGPGTNQTVDLVVNNLVIGTASIVSGSLTSLRITLDKTNGMQFKEPTTFYYEAEVNYYKSGETTITTTGMYSSVTVIPATTVYYEDDFLTLKSFTDKVEDNPSKWEQSAQSGTQATDRPGENKNNLMGSGFDADNKYGYDGAYSSWSDHSMGSAAKITVSPTVRGEATFTFWGTGFDVFSMTSNATGTITVKVTDASGNTVKSTIVDTYYGYTKDANGEWVVSNSTANSLYQVPVMKISGLTYGQYTVKITAGYNDFFNHTATSGSYDLYLDAIRIYDPTGNQNDEANNAYIKDNEGYPYYEELRDNVISAEGVTVDAETGKVTFPTDDAFVKGAIFIDGDDANTSVKDYVNYGPNNELYLMPGQAVAFNVTMTSTVADVQLGIKVGNGDTVTYKINGDEYTVSTTTDMYYSILEYAQAGTVVIESVSGGILSLTNIKVTYTEAPADAADLLWISEETATFALMSLRSAPPAMDDDEPEATEPEVTEPEVTEPEVTEPEVTEPEVTEPEVTEPEATEPEVTEPEVTEPEATEPEATEPEATEPEVTEPEATEPEVDEEPTEEEEPGFWDQLIGAIGGFFRKLFGWIFG